MRRVCTCCVVCSEYAVILLAGFLGGVLLGELLVLKCVDIIPRVACQVWVSAFQVSVVKVCFYVIVVVSWVLINVWAGVGCFVSYCKYSEPVPVSLHGPYGQAPEIFAC